MDTYLTPDQLAQSAYLQMMHDLMSSTIPMALKIMFLLTIGGLLLLIIIAGFARNVERDKERERVQPTPSVTPAPTAAELRYGVRFAELEEGKVIPISRARRDATPNKAGSDDSDDDGVA